MAVDETTFKMKYPQFENVSSAVFALWLDESTRNVAESYFGDQFDYATELWIAWKLLQLDQGKRGVNGPISSHSFDGESWSYENKGEATNTYERQYHELKMRKYRGGCVV